MAKLTSANPAGDIVVRLFVRTEINPDCTQNLTRPRFSATSLSRKLLAYFVLFLIMAFFIVDVVDLFFHGIMRDVSYGKVNAIITMIGFSSSQVYFFQAAASTLIVVHRADRIKVCINYANIQVDMSTVKPNFRERFRRRSYVLYILILLTGFCYAMFGIQDRVPRLYAADQLYPYSLFRIPLTPLKYYLFFAQYFSIIVNFSFVIVIFSITALLYEYIENINRKLSLARTGSTDVYALRHNYEEFLSFFSAARKAFGELLLVEAIISGVQLMIILSWFCTWISVPEAGDPLKACKMGFSGIGAVIVLCVTMYGPIRLSSMQDKLTENAEKLSEYHQKTSKIMSVGEMDFLDSFVRRIRLRSLTFVAGEILHLNMGAIIKGIFVLVGFFCYIVERIENSSPFSGLVDHNATSSV